MRDYGKVRTAFWTDERVSAMSDDGKLLALYLITSPHANAVGCYRLPVGYVSDDIGWDRGRVEKAFSELTKAGFALRCARTGWTLIVHYLRHNEIENGNVGKACVRMLEQVPASVPFAEQLLKAIEPSRERFPNGFLERYAERFRNGMPTPEPEPNQEPSVEAGASTGPAGAAPQGAPAADEPKVQPQPKPAEQTPTEQDLVWGDGLDWLSRSSGKARDGLRSMLGRWCKVYSAADVLAVMSDCRSQSPPVPGPVAWIEAALKFRKQANGQQNRGSQRSTSRQRNGWCELAESELGLGFGVAQPGSGGRIIADDALEGAFVRLS